MKPFRRRAGWPVDGPTDGMSSVVLRTAIRLILPLTFMYAVYAALKGHNGPGGGFIAGLVAAVGLCTYRMSYGDRAFHRMLPLHPRWLVFGGLGLAGSVAALPLTFGRPLLRSAATTVHVGGADVHLVSSTAFDMGVLLVVVGVAIGMINRLDEEVER